MDINVKGYIETEGRERWIEVGTEHTIYGKDSYPSGYGKAKFLKQRRINGKWEYFELIESDEPMLEDDLYELIGDDSIYIQVVSDCQCSEYVVNKFFDVGDESYSKQFGTFDNLEDAKQECIKVFKGEVK